MAAAAAAGAGAGVRPLMTGAKPAEERYRKELWQNPLNERIFLCFNDQKQGIMYAIKAQKAVANAPQNELCFFYAIQRILTEEQNLPELIQQCEVRQKGIAAGQKVAKMVAAKKKENLSQAALDAVVAKANDQFFKTLGLDHQAQLDQFRLDYLKQDLRTIHGAMPQAQLMQQVTQAAQVHKQNPNLKFMLVELLAEKTMAERFGLKPMAYAEYMTQEGMKTALRTYGPFVIHGEFGLIPNKTKKRERSHIHPIVVVGLKSGKKKEDGIVCWINPNDNSRSPKVQEASFGAFTDKIGLIVGSPTEGPGASAKEFSARAYYNPFFARIPPDINPIYPILSALGFQDQIASEIFKFCDIKPDHPYKLCDDDNRIIFAMPRGKIDKKGQVAVQKAQKGPTCLYYAIRRILTTVQVRSEHGRHCSELRRAFTAIDTRALDNGSEKEAKKQAKAVGVFLGHKKISMKEASAEGYALLGIRAFRINNMMAQIFPELATNMPYEDLAERPHLAYIYVQDLMAQGYGLELFEQSSTLKTKEDLIHYLRAKGPFVVGGHLGRAGYNIPATVLPETLGEQPLYGWSDAVPYIPTGLHAVVVIGAETVNDKGYVYWIDPNDSSADQRIYKGPSDVFIARLGNPELAKSNLGKMGLNQTVFGYSNPQFASKQPA